MNLTELQETRKTYGIIKRINEDFYNVWYNGASDTKTSRRIEAVTKHLQLIETAIHEQVHELELKALKA